METVLSRAIVWLAVMFACVTSVVRAQDLTGNWQGTLQQGNGIRVLFKISKAPDGSLKGLGYNVDQPGSPVALSAIALQGTDVSFAIKQLDMTYAGNLSADHNAITGKMRQNGEPHALNLDHVSDENAWAIPEPPKQMPADARPKFEVVTVKPSDPDRPGKLFTVRGRHIVTINTNLNDLISFAYGLHAKQIVGAPEWFGTEKFDVDGVPDIDGRPNQDQFKLLMQDVLT